MTSAAAVLAAGLALTACGSPASNTAAGGSSTLSTPSSTAPSVNPGGPLQLARTGTPVPTTQITAGAGDVLGQQVWTQQDGKLLVLAAEESGCETVAAQVTQQTTTEVDVKLVVTNTKKPGQVCPMIIRQVTVGATLQAPLGTRKLVIS